MKKPVRLPLSAYLAGADPLTVLTAGIVAAGAKQAKTISEMARSSAGSVLWRAPNKADIDAIRIVSPPGTKIDPATPLGQMHAALPKVNRVVADLGSIGKVTPKSDFDQSVTLCRSLLERSFDQTGMQKTSLGFVSGAERRPRALRWPLRVAAPPGEAGEKLRHVLAVSEFAERHLIEVFAWSKGAEADLVVADANSYPALDPLSNVGAILYLGQLDPEAGRFPKTPGQAPLIVTGAELGADAFDTLLAPGVLHFNAIIRAFSHNNALDQAVLESFQYLPTLKWVAPVFYANSLDDLDALVADAGRAALRERLGADPTGMIYLSPFARETLNIPKHFDKAVPNQVIAEALKTAPPYHQEREGASAQVEVARGLDDNPPPPAGPEQRVTDVDIARVDKPDESVKDTCLIAGRSYRLSVQICPPENATGISAEGADPIRGVRFDDKTDVRQIDVCILPRAGGGWREWAPPVSAIERIELRRDGASTIAQFDLTPELALGGATSTAFLRVDLYCNLNLVDRRDLEFVVIAEGAAIPDHPGASASGLRQNAPPLIDFDAPAKFLTLSVRKDLGGNYALTWIWQAEEGDDRLIVKSSPVISPTELASIQTSIRAVLYELVLQAGKAADPSAPFAVDGYDEKRALQKLARPGSELWAKLIGAQGLEGVERLLDEKRLGDGGAIQIIFDRQAGDLVLPLGFLYRGDIGDGVNPKALWKNFFGARYEIETLYESARPAAAAPVQSSARAMACMLWRSFKEADSEVEALRTWAKAADVAFAPPNIEDADSFFDRLNDASIGLYYFFCHGQTRPADANAGRLFADEIKVILSGYTQKPAWAGTAEDLARILSDSSRAQETSIQLTQSTILYSDLKNRGVRDIHGAIMVLNMCQSAQNVFGVSPEFVSLFQRWRAQTVIGTECFISPALGQCFSDAFRTSLGAGASCARALMAARQTMRAKGFGPLGLAYTLYGRGAACLSKKETIDA